MNILYVSSAVDEIEFDLMKKEIKLKNGYTAYGMQEAGNKFHRLLIEGISKDNKVYSLVGRPISRIHNKLFWKNKKRKVNDNLSYEYITVINIPIIKQLFSAISIFVKTLKWLFKNRKNDEKIIIFDATFVSIIPFIILATRFCKCKKISIVADVYNYMAEVKPINGRKENFVSGIIRKIIKYCYNRVDGFILLTEQMNELINENNRPYIVIEGFADIKMAKLNNSIENKNKKNIIMYAGALKKEYGLDILIEGFELYNDNNSELWIYGDGTYVKQIIEESKQDNRIHFMGIADNSTIIEKEMEATILLNPRPTKDEFTKYSFPSKNMEYMSSGTLVLTTKLAGIPEEYYNFIELIEEETPQGIANKLCEILGKNRLELQEKGKKAKEFVLTQKNNMKQGERIIKFINNLIFENKNDKSIR